MRQPLYQMLFVCIVCLATSGCMLPNQVQTPPPEKPGFYALTGWNGQQKYENGDHYVAYAVDIDGRIGYPLTVYGPTARCVPKTSAGWSASVEILSGKLPPGLAFAKGDNITGIPTERGHWIVKLKMYNMLCNGNYYWSLIQEIRFHIGGSGVVKD